MTNPISKLAHQSPQPACIPESSFFRLASLLCLAAWIGAPAARAHPLQAEPINHAFVPCFDQFHLKEDPDEHLAQGGLLLLAELSCAACHAAPAAWKERLSPKPGPDLSAVGSRLDGDTIWLMVRSPQHRKKGTQMPGLFAGEEGDAEKAEALTEYLASLKKAPQPMPKGDEAKGRELYHTVGCVACHEPAAEADYRPHRAPKDVELERPGNGSAPIALADAYELSALADFLFDPLRHRPAGRMPNMRLSQQEAADIAAYLHVGRAAEKAVERAVLKLPKQGIEMGRKVFAQQRCANCHTTGEKLPAALAAKPMASLDASGGCLGDSIPSSIARFDLNDLQKRALRLALARIQQPRQPAIAVQERIDWHMSRLNCYACHDRNHKGGPEDPRAQYFEVNDPGAESLGELAHLPPSLDRIGRKLTRGWLEKVLWGQGGGVRPYMEARMPSFGREATEPLIAMLEEADRLPKPVPIDVSGLEKHHRAELGRQLLGAKGLACVACHGLKDRKALGPPVMRLTHTVERLQPAYFKELLLNPQATQTGTVMPPMFAGRKKADEEIESIWTYLREVQGQPLPEGLMSAEDFELKPDKAGRVIVFRTFIEGAGAHAIGVGFPGGLNAAFDAKAGRWALIWKGRFLDAMSNWQERANPPVKPLGTEVKALPAEPGERQFRGYRLAKDGTPTFLYVSDGKMVEDTLRPATNGFERSVMIDGIERKEQVAW